ncbi:MAG: hypothetical protein HOV81_44930 [Kofleriaceae bacterium]|nr:hypothetical protein [Kofleriaceae bacterium]
MTLTSRAALLALCAAAGFGCSSDSSSTQVITGRVSTSAIAVRAVSGSDVIAAAQVRTDGSFTIALPKGKTYRLEVLSSAGVHHVMSYQGRTPHDLAFTVCNPQPPFDTGMLTPGMGGGGGNTPTCDPAIDPNCAPCDPTSDPNCKPADCMADGTCCTPGDANCGWPCDPMTDPNCGQPCDRTTDPTCGWGCDPDDPNCVTCDPADPDCTPPCNPMTDPNCGGGPTCDPMTDPSCAPPCDRLTDPNCGQPCDPMTDPNCAPPCNPLTDPGCGGGDPTCNPMTDPNCLPPPPICMDPTDPYCNCDANGTCPPPTCDPATNAMCPPPPPPPCTDPMDITTCQDPCMADPVQCGCALGDPNCWPAPQPPECDADGMCSGNGMSPQFPPGDFGCEELP